MYKLSQSIFMFSHRVLYWTDIGGTPRIEKSYLDGTGRQVFIGWNLLQPNGIAVDYITNRSANITQQ